MTMDNLRISFLAIKRDIWTGELLGAWGRQFGFPGWLTIHTRPR